MTVRRPSRQELADIASALSMSLTDEDISFFLELTDGGLAAFDAIDALPDYLPQVEFPRTGGRQPERSENPLNAWYVKCEIAGAPGGKLAGKTVVIKDNIAVAGLPMMNGSSLLEGYVPEVDATVVSRLLRAGATILGKAHCEYYCLSGGSHTSAHGPVRNPHKRDHSSAGSSSGCAALVASGEVDMAVGGDQGGSIRTPASYCGIVGLKPTWGLVPYTGAMPIELTIDHLGPMTANVADNALMLEVIAGFDGLDPRQSAQAIAQDYTKALDEGCAGLRIGVLAEGFDRENSQSDVDNAVRAAAAHLGSLGAVVEEVSVPMHLSGPAIWLAIAFEGATQQMMKGNSHGFSWKGMYLTSLIEAHGKWRDGADELPDTVKQTMLLGEYVHRLGGGRFYGKAQNLARKLRAEYDAALARYDILVMPTTPMKAPLLPPMPDTAGEVSGNARRIAMQRATENMDNTFPFDVTGHPALSIPCAMNGGLPVGMMLVGRHFDESTLYRAAQAFERSTDWRSRSST